MNNNAKFLLQEFYDYANRRGLSARDARAAYDEYTATGKLPEGMGHLYGIGAPTTVTSGASYRGGNAYPPGTRAWQITYDSNGNRTTTELTPNLGTSTGAGTGGSQTSGTPSGANPTGGAGSKIFSDNLKSKFGNFTGKLSSPSFDYNLKSGVKGWGLNLGKGLNAINLATQGMQLADNMGDMSSAQRNADELISDILTGASGSSTLQYDLTPDQMSLLRQLQRGTYDSGAELSDVDVGGSIGGAIKGGIMGLGGGLPGVAIGAIGGALNSGYESATSAIQRRNAELEALYSAIVSAQQQRNSILRDRAYANI